MKYLIPLAFILVLVGCDPTPDMNGSPDKAASTASGEARAAHDTADRAADQAPKAEVLRFGLYRAEKKGEIRESSDTNTGKVIRNPLLEHLKTTDRVPLAKDTYFGFQYRLWNLPTEALVKNDIELRKVLMHPPMTLPDGSESTGWERSFSKEVKDQQITGFNGYAFSEAYELVEGDWVLQIWYQDRKLLEQSFTSVWLERAKSADATGEE